MDMYRICIYADNGMERFNWDGFVFAENSAFAKEYVTRRFGGDIVRVLSVCKYKPLPGEVFSKS